MSDRHGADSSHEEILDLLVVGGGVYGICAANTYLAIHPEANIRVLEGGADIGGCWSASRLYPKFWSQTGARLSGYPDKPLTIPSDSPLYNELFEARHLTQYLEDYVRLKQYDGRSLWERVCLQCWVQHIYKIMDIWVLEVQEKERKVNYHTRKLIIATGLTSVPHMPDLPGRGIFGGSIFHQRDFGRSGIFTDTEPDIARHEHVVILGGSKSAADMAYAAATDTTRARKVSWIIRRSGRGPLAVLSSRGIGKYRNPLEAASTRAAACSSMANPWAENGLLSYFLHRTRFGRLVRDRAHSQISDDAIKLANFYGRTDALPGFAQLIPDMEDGQPGGTVGLQQHDDFWDVISTKVNIHRQDIDHLEEHDLVLQDGKRIKMDLLLCGTGWKQEHPYFDAQQTAQLGLPVSIENSEYLSEQRERWHDLDQEADQRVLHSWPHFASGLSRQPSTSPPLPQNRSSKATTPYRLYNFTTPLEDHSIAFLGLSLFPNSFHASPVLSLYAIAVLDGAIKLPSKREMARNIAFVNAWARYQYPNRGGDLGNIVDIEAISFTDHLLRMLGLQSHRTKECAKNCSLLGLRRRWADLTDPCVVSQYAGLVDEYKRRYYPNVSM